MYKDKTFLAIVPARGGSKRLPRKNILELNGKPLITWSIEAGLNSKYIDKLIVSSDNQKILEIAQLFGASTLTRPAELSIDTATTFDVLKHAIEHNEHYDYVILLQPTSPLRNAKHIDAAIELLLKKKADAIVSVCKVSHSPLWCNTLPIDDSFNSFLSKEIKNKRSQDLQTYYRLNGAIYICNTNRLIQEQTIIFDDNIFAYKMEPEDSVDIDTKMDFLYTEFLLKNRA